MAIIKKTASWLLTSSTLWLCLLNPSSVLCQNLDTTTANPRKMAAQISRQMDSNYIYPYSKTKFVPPEGNTLLIMGQTFERINEYLDAVPEQPLPGGWSAYWGITEFKGIKETHTNETGTSQNHQMLADRFPNAIIHSSLWMVGMWDVAKRTDRGDFDKVLKKYCKWAKSIHRPIYLRIGYEFDGPHNQLEPFEYVEAYRHIVDFFRKEGVSNIAYVWHSYAAKPYKDYSVSAWYPGDDYVDWVGISVFGHAYKGVDFGVDCEAVLTFAKEHQKPVMIAESNPIYGIHKDDIDAWEAWFVNFFSFIYAKNIKAVSFINEDWTDTKIAGLEEWKDSRIYNNQRILEAWFDETNKAKYLKESPSLFQVLGYERKR
jgi:hypothetical protein